MVAVLANQVSIVKPGLTTLVSVMTPAVPGLNSCTCHTKAGLAPVSVMGQ
jgi:hypothetical protein